MMKYRRLSGTIVANVVQLVDTTVRQQKYIPHREEGYWYPV